jgi:hypothetical protein
MTIQIKNLSASGLYKGSHDHSDQKSLDEWSLLNMRTDLVLHPMGKMKLENRPHLPIRRFSPFFVELVLIRGVIFRYRRETRDLGGLYEKNPVVIYSFFFCISTWLY